MRYRPLKFASDYRFPNHAVPWESNADISDDARAANAAFLAKHNLEPKSSRCTHWTTTPTRGGNFGCMLRAGHEGRHCHPVIAPKGWTDEQGVYLNSQADQDAWNKGWTR